LFKPLGQAQPKYILFFADGMLQFCLLKTVFAPPAGVLEVSATGQTEQVPEDVE